MAARSQVKGQIAIPLPPQMTRRSLAWQSRRDQRAEYRAAFDEARQHGLRTRHVLKQIRADTDASLRDLGLLPDTRSARSTSPTPSQQTPGRVPSPARQ